MRTRMVISLVAFALVAGACTGSSDGGADSTERTTSGVEVGGGDVPQEVAAEFEADLAPLPAVAVEPGSVLPGETVEVSGLEDAVGTVSIVGPAGTIIEEPVTESNLSVTIPSDGPTGQYLVVAESADGLPAVAAFRVGGGPVLTLAVDGDGLVATADGVPLDTPALITAGNGDDAELLEAGPGGLLLPVSGEPATVLADYLGVHLEIPPTVQGEMRLVTGAGDDAGISSNTVVMDRCDPAAAVTGDLGGPGEARAVWLGAHPGSFATATEDGPYRIEVGPGSVIVTEYPEGGEPRSVVATSSCGFDTNLRDGDGSVGGFSPEGIGDETWTGLIVVGPDETAVDEGAIVCTIEDGSVDLSLFDDLDFAIGLDITVDGYAGDGTYAVPGFFFDDSGTFADAMFSVEITEAPDGTISGSFSGSAETIEAVFDGAFRCGFDAFQGLEAPGVLASYRAGSGHDPCRIGIVQIPDIGPEVAYVLTRRLAEGLPLVTWYTTGDIAALLDAAGNAQKQNRDGAEFVEEARRILHSADYRVTVTIREALQSYEDQRWWVFAKGLDVERGIIVARSADSGPDIASLKTQPNSGRFITQIGQSGICGYADPLEATIGPGEKQQFSYDVVDLIDTPVFDARVSIKDREDGAFSPDCGSLKPLTGSSSDFATTFTAADEIKQDCTEYPRFEAVKGDIETKADREPGADATVHVGSKWEFHVTLVKRTPDGDLTWRIGSDDEPGVFYVRESGAIVGGAPGSFDGIRSCERHENGALTYKEPPTEVIGTWSSWLGGSLVDNDTGRFFRFAFDGAGWSSVWPPLPDECGGELLSFAEGILRFVGYNIDRILLTRVQLPVEATTVTFAVDPEGLPDATFEISIRPADTGE